MDSRGRNIHTCMPENEYTLYETNMCLIVVLVHLLALDVII